jgi:flagellar hook assembly protein FlgD
VRLELFDLLGRRIRRLVDDERFAGESRVAWDGSDDSGRSLGPGVYLARLEFLGVSKTIRLVRIR